MMYRSRYSSATTMSPTPQPVTRSPLYNEHHHKQSGAVILSLEQHDVTCDICQDVAMLTLDVHTILRFTTTMACDDVICCTLIHRTLPTLRIIRGYMNMLTQNADRMIRITTAMITENACSIPQIAKTLVKFIQPVDRIFKTVAAMNTELGLGFLFVSRVYPLNVNTLLTAPRPPKPVLRPFRMVSSTRLRPTSTSTNTCKTSNMANITRSTSLSPFNAADFQHYRTLNHPPGTSI